MQFIAFSCCRKGTCFEQIAVRLTPGKGWSVERGAELTRLRGDEVQHLESIRTSKVFVRLGFVRVGSRPQGRDGPFQDFNSTNIHVSIGGWSVLRNQCEDTLVQIIFAAKVLDSKSYMN